MTIDTVSTDARTTPSTTASAPVATAVGRRLIHSAIVARRAEEGDAFDGATIRHAFGSGVPSAGARAEAHDAFVEHNARVAALDAELRGVEARLDTPPILIAFASNIMEAANRVTVCASRLGDPRVSVGGQVEAFFMMLYQVLVTVFFVALLPMQIPFTLVFRSIAGPGRTEEAYFDHAERRRADIQRELAALRTPSPDA